MHAFSSLPHPATEPCLFSANEQVVGKNLEALAQHNNGFINVEGPLTNAQIMGIAGELGIATAPVLRQTGSRQATNIKGIRLAQLDFDNTWSIAEALQHDIYMRAGIGLHTTDSHGQPQGHLTPHQIRTLPPEQMAVLESRVGEPMERFRILLRLQDLLPAAKITDFYNGLFVCFPMADRSCKDSSRVFFGCKGAAVCLDNPDAIPLPSEVVEELVALGRQQRASLPRSGQQYSYGQTAGGLRLTPKGYEPVRQNLCIRLTDGTVTSTDILKQSMSAGYANRQPCFSPFRQDKHPSCFLQLDDAGRLYLIDSATQAKYMWF